MGYEVKIGDMTSGLHAIAIAPDTLTGGADPRREGLAVGQ
jgi:gamma-glutamyltranspeptidase/glutathione hydrolase